MAANLEESMDNILKRIFDLTDWPQTLVTIATTGGLLIFLCYVIYLTFELVQGLRLYVLSRCCLMEVDFVEKYGRWAVITGGGLGIGRSMARQLARRGMSLIIIDKNTEALVATKAMLERETNVGQVETIDADLADPSSENFNNIMTQIDPTNRDVGVLINNVGMMSKLCAKFDQIDPDSMITMINVNMVAMVQLTRALLPGMLEHQKGLIVNVSSVHGTLPLPYFSVYAPTKAFVDSFTRQLQMEYRSQPIDIVLLRPVTVLTDICDGMKTMRPSIFAASPDEYAKSAISALSAGINTYSGLIRHGLIRILSFPVCFIGLHECVARGMMYEFNRRGGIVRERALAQIDSQKKSLATKGAGAHIVKFDQIQQQRNLAH